MRKNVYFSERLDKDLIYYMKEHNFEGDFSQNIKRLLRDGIKRREEGTIERKALIQPSVPKEVKAISRPQIDFSDIGTEKKEVDLSELDDRFNAL